MTIAEIHGKSPSTTSEDMLTADVFTAFRYLPAAEGIVGFLRTIPGVAAIIPEPDAHTLCDYHFWPLGRYREPDLLLELTIAGAIYHVLVEAKYHSGPSDNDLVQVGRGEESILLGNQLADQLRGLEHGEYTIFRQGVRNEHRQLRSYRSKRLLLYLTAHPLRPAIELDRAASLFPAGKPGLFWASWYHVNDYLISAQERFATFPYNLIVADALTLLSRKQFSSFAGFTLPPEIEFKDRSGSFWTGRPEPLPSFSGVKLPLIFDTADISGSFWLDV